MAFTVRDSHSDAPKENPLDLSELEAGNNYYIIGAVRVASIYVLTSGERPLVLMCGPWPAGIRPEWADPSHKLVQLSAGIPEDDDVKEGFVLDKMVGLDRYITDDDLFYTYQDGRSMLRVAHVDSNPKFQKLKKPETMKPAPPVKVFSVLEPQPA